MPICKVCGKDSFWTVDVVSKICKDCNQKKKSGKEESEIRSEKEKLEKSHQDLIHQIK